MCLYVLCVCICIIVVFKYVDMRFDGYVNVYAVDVDENMVNYLVVDNIEYVVAMCVVICGVALLVLLR